MATKGMGGIPQAFTGAKGPAPTGRPPARRPQGVKAHGVKVPAGNSHFKAQNPLGTQFKVKKGSK